MSWKLCRTRVVQVGLTIVLLGLTSGVRGEPAAIDKAESLPKFPAVEKAVREHFAKLPDYRGGEILSRNQVGPIFRILENMGWSVADQKAILEAVLPDTDPLVRQLRTEAGKKFARQVATVPQGYDRLDRLRRASQGQQRVGNLIQGPDGYLMIKYMTTTSGGRELGRMLSRTPGGQNFNKPTERIYTVDQLVDRLKQEYAKTVGKSASTPP